MTNTYYFLYIGAGLIGAYIEFKEAKSKTYENALNCKNKFDRTFTLNASKRQVIDLIESKLKLSEFVSSYRDDDVIVLEELTTWKNYGWYYVVRAKETSSTSCEVVISSMYKVDRYILDFFHNRKLNKLFKQLGVI